MLAETLFITVGGQDDGPTYVIPAGAVVVPRKIDDPRLGRLIHIVGLLSDLGAKSKRDAALFGPIIGTLMGEVQERFKAEPMPG